jgi:thiosulfate/3-mercaptopyruvate sulfurtransferase
MSQLLLTSALAAFAALAPALAPALASVPTVPTAPQAPPADIIVSAGWLRAHIGDPDIIVLDLTMPGMDSPDPYAAGHIPGSRALDFHSLFTGDGENGSLTMELLAPDSLEHVLEGLGVSDRSTIVLYSTSRWVSPVARGFMTLDYLGLGARTHILDGGYDAWKASGGSVSTVSPTIRRGTLHVAPRRDVVISAADVRSHLGDSKVSIIDARAPEFYSGAQRGHGSVRSGHVPGARNVYFLTLADSVTDTYLTPAQARARFFAAGIRLDRPAIVYCHIGQTASVDYVQLRRLGVPVRLYDGSFQDWSRHADYPVTVSATP